MSAAAFGMVILLSARGVEADKLDDFKGLNQRNSWYAAVMAMVMFSMAGVPVFVGFFAKWLVIKAALDAGLIWLAIVAVVFSVVGAFYYLRVVKLMYFDEPVTESADRRAGRFPRGYFTEWYNDAWTGYILEFPDRGLHGLLRGLN